MTTKPCNCQLASPLAIDEPAVYRICVAGRIPLNWRDRFDNMAIATTETPNGQVVTTLLGVVADQAALVGVINGLHDVRVAMLCVERLETPPTSPY